MSVDYSFSSLAFYSCTMYYDLNNQKDLLDTSSAIENNEWHEISTEIYCEG